MRHYRSFIRSAAYCAAVVLIHSTAVITVKAGGYLVSEGSLTPDLVWNRTTGRVPSEAERLIRLRAFGDTVTVNLPLDVLVVTDNSGSMGTRRPGDRDYTDPSRIQGTYNACVSFVDDVLDTNDRIAHMRFCAVVDTVNGFSSDFEAVKADFDTTIDGRETVDGIRYRGTAVWTGIHMAAIYAVANRRPGTIPVVIAMTDGKDNASGSYGSYYRSAYPNLGDAQRDAVDSVISVLNRYGDSLRVFTINLGSDGNEAYMREIAVAGNGEWRYSPDGGGLNAVFQDIGTRIQRTAAVELSGDSAMVVDVLPPYISYVPGSWTTGAGNTAAIDSFGVRTVADSLTVLEFFVNEINVDETFEVTYRLRSSRSGRVIANYGFGTSNAAGMLSQVQYRDYVGTGKMITYFATRYLDVADTLRNDRFGLTATAVDSGSVAILFDTERAEGLLLDTFYLYGSDGGWVTSGGTPLAVIPADSMAAWDCSLAVTGLAADTRYFFTVAARNRFGERSRIDTLRGDTARTMPGRCVRSIGIRAERTVLTTVEAAACTAYGYYADGELRGPVPVSWSVTDSCGRFDPADGADGVFTADYAGTAYLVAVYRDSITDTLELRIDPAPSVRLVITDETGGEAGDMLLAADSMGAVLAATGYDARGRLTGTLGAMWMMLPTGGTGTLVPEAGGAYRFVPQVPGSVRIAAVSGALADTTGLVVVVPGRPVDLMLQAGPAYVAAGDTVPMAVTAADARGNVTPLPVDLAWELPPELGGSVIPAGAGAFHAVFTGTGSGTPVVTSTAYALRDTGGLITVGAGPTARIEIGPFDGDTLVMYRDETRTFTAYGYDRFGNPTGMQSVDWDTAGMPAGTFDGLGYGGTLAFTSDAPGTGCIVAASGNLRDTLVIRVSGETVTAVRIMLGGMRPLADTTLTTDNDSLAVAAYGYNDRDSLLGAVNVAWSLTVPGLGYAVPAYGRRTAVVFTRPGSGAVRATYRDTVTAISGTITVLPGALRSVRVLPADTTVQRGDTVRFGAAGFDADGNALADPGIPSWSGTGVSGSINAVTGAYAATAVGLDTVRVLITGTGGTEYAATGIVRTVARPAYFVLRPERTEVSAGRAVACTLIVYDDTGIPVSGTVPFPDGLDLVPLVADGDTLVPADPAQVRIEGADDLPAVLAGGRTVLYVTYDEAGRRLFVRCTDPRSGITGTSEEGIMWLHPDLLSHVCPYPSPMNFNRVNGLSLEYRLRFDGAVTVVIVSAAGGAVLERTVRAGEEGGRAGINTLRWDGRNRKGKDVGSGAYWVRITVTTDNGIMEETRKIGIIGRK